MKNIDRETILKAKKKAIAAYAKGLRYYDEKHNTYCHSWYSANILEHVSDLIGYYGLESYDPNDPNPSRPKYSYVNSGDTYNLTLIYNHNSRRFLICDIGTIIEKETV